MNLHYQIHVENLSELTDHILKNNSSSSDHKF